MSAVLSAVQLFSQCSLLVMSSFCCVSSLSVLLYLAWFLWLVHVISFIMRFWWQCPCGDITWCKCVSGPISLGIITHDIKDISSRLNLATLVEVSDRVKSIQTPFPTSYPNNNYSETCLELCICHYACTYFMWALIHNNFITYTRILWICPYIYPTRMHKG